MHNLSSLLILQIMYNCWYQLLTVILYTFSFPFATPIFNGSCVSNKYPCSLNSVGPELQIIVVTEWQQCKWEFHWQWDSGTHMAAEKTKEMAVNWMKTGLLLSTEQDLIIESKNMKITCQHIVLLWSTTTSCLLNRPYLMHTAVLASSAGYCASNMAAGFNVVCNFLVWLKWRQNR